MGTLTGMTDGKAEFDRSLGDRIRGARQRVGVRQEQLADALGLSRTSITNIERGRQGVQAYLLVRIAEVLGRPVADLLPDQGSRSASSVPEKVKSLEPNKRQWAERVMSTPKEDDDHAA